MIVEFCGVPGGGKSTTVRMYREKYPQTVEYITINMYKRIPEFFHASMFALLHPISFFWILLFIVRFHMKGVFWYSLHLALRACGKYHKASMYKGPRIVFVDEGLVHVLCALSAYPIAQEKMNVWLDRIIFPNVICIAKSGTFHRFHRKDVSVHPRIKKGDKALVEWESAVRTNVLRVNEYLQKKGVHVWDIPEGNSSIADVELLHLYLSNI